MKASIFQGAAAGGIAAYVLFSNGLPRATRTERFIRMNRHSMGDGAGISVIKVRHMFVCAEWVCHAYQAGWHRRYFEFITCPSSNCLGQVFFIFQVFFPCPL